MATSSKYVTDGILMTRGSEEDADPLGLIPASYHCTYARMWIAVKSSWDLTITAAEKSALEEMLNTC
jgi:hypothetical protein